MLSFLYGPTLTSIHDYWKNYTFDYTEFVGKVMSLLFDTLSRLVFVIITLGINTNPNPWDSTMKKKTSLPAILWEQDNMAEPPE